MQLKRKFETHKFMEQRKVEKLSFNPTSILKIDGILTTIKKPTGGYYES